LGARRGRSRDWGQKNKRYLYRWYFMNYKDLRGLVGVITDDNFYVNGTLKDNLGWKVKDFNDA
jgi:hypothetical protein